MLTSLTGLQPEYVDDAVMTVQGLVQTLAEFDRPIHAQPISVRVRFDRYYKAFKEGMNILFAIGEAWNIGDSLAFLKRLLRDRTAEGVIDLIDEDPVDLEWSDYSSGFFTRFLAEILDHKKVWAAKIRLGLSAPTGSELPKILPVQASLRLSIALKNLLNADEVDDPRPDWFADAVQQLATEAFLCWRDLATWATKKYDLPDWQSEMSSAADGLVAQHLPRHTHALNEINLFLSSLCRVFRRPNGDHIQMVNPADSAAFDIFSRARHKQGLNVLASHWKRLRQCMPFFEEDDGWVDWMKEIDAIRLPVIDMTAVMDDAPTSATTTRTPQTKSPLKRSLGGRGAKKGKREKATAEATKYCDANGFPGVNQLASILGYSTGFISEICKDDLHLRQLKKDAAGRKGGGGRAVRMNDVHLDGTAQSVEINPLESASQKEEDENEAEKDKIIDKLVKECAKKDRPAAETALRAQSLKSLRMYAEAVRRS